MNTKAVLTEIDAQITKLQSARAAIVAIAEAPATKKRGRGRPPKSDSVIAKPVAKRKMSPEGKARIAAAQKKRWAAQKKSAKKS